MINFRFLAISVLVGESSNKATCSTCGSWLVVCLVSNTNFTTGITGYAVV